MLLQEMTEMFLDSRKRGTTGARKRATNATLKIYRSNLSLFTGFLMSETKQGGVVDYKMIRRLHITSFLDYLDTKTWSIASRLQVLRTLRTFFRWVDLDEDCKDAELKGLQRYLPAIEQCPRREYIPAKVDLNRWRNSFNLSNRWGFRDYVMFNLLISTGTRLGEVCNLKVVDVNFDQKYILVNGKTGTRTVPLDREVGPMLKGWIKRRASCPTAQESEFMFVSKYTNKVDVKAWGYRLRRHREKNSLPKLTAHTLRHYFATVYLKNGGSIEKLRVIIGHQSYAMLLKYLHTAQVAGKEIQEEFDRVNPMRELL